MMAGVTPRQNALRCRRMVAVASPELRRTQFDRIQRDCILHTVQLLRGPCPPVRKDTRQLRRVVLDQENVRRTWKQLYQAAVELNRPWNEWRWNLRLLVLWLTCFMLFGSTVPTC